jgi:hypothetical protein
MGEPTAGQGLAADRYVTIVLRMRVDEQGRLVESTIVCIDGRTLARCRDWDTLLRELRECGAAGP